VILALAVLFALAAYILGAKRGTSRVLYSIAFVLAVIGLILWVASKVQG